MKSEKETHFFFSKLERLVTKQPHKSQHAQTFVTLYLHFHARYRKAQISYYTIRNNGIIYKGNYAFLNRISCRSLWLRGLRCGSAVARLLGLWVRIPQGAWISVCCVLSGRGLCVGLITRREESYRVWCFWMWSWILYNEEALAHWGLLDHGKKIEVYIPTR
jgi:hypothetical protein